MAVPLARSLNPSAIVYDCMDELTQLPDAPPEIAERERELFDCADVVFTGVPASIRESGDTIRTCTASRAT